MAGMTAQRRGDSETKSKGPRASTSTSQQLAVLTLLNHCLLFMVTTFQRQPRTFLEHTGSPLVTTLPLELKTVFIHPSIHSLNFTIAQCQDAALGVLRSTRPTPCPEKISLWGEDSEVKRPSSHAVTAPWLCGETVGVLGGGRERLSPGGDTEGPIVARAWDLRFKPQVATHRRKRDRDCPGSTVFIGEGVPARLQASDHRLHPRFSLDILSLSFHLTRAPPYSSANLRVVRVQTHIRSYQTDLGDLLSYAGKAKVVTKYPSDDVTLELVQLRSSWLPH